jgi:hypothetical protein
MVDHQQHPLPCAPYTMSTIREFAKSLFKSPSNFETYMENDHAIFILGNDVEKFNDKRNPNMLLTIIALRRVDVLFEHDTDEDSDDCDEYIGTIDFAETSSTGADNAPHKIIDMPGPRGLIKSSIHETWNSQPGYDGQICADVTSYTEYYDGSKVIHLGDYDHASLAIQQNESDIFNINNNEPISEFKYMYIDEHNEYIATGTREFIDDPDPSKNKTVMLAIHVERLLDVTCRVVFDSYCC